MGQGIAAGELANGTAALFVSALGTGTTALMLRSAWLLRWLNHGQHLTAIAAYRYENNAGGGAAAYLFMLIWFPVIGLFMSALGAACTPLGRPAPRELTPVPAAPGGACRDPPATPGMGLPARCRPSGTPAYINCKEFATLSDIT